MVRDSVCVNHLLGNTEVVLYVTFSVSIIYWAIQKQYCTSHCICINHLLDNTEVVLTIVRHIVSVSIIYWTIQKQYCTSHCICVNHLLGNTGLILYITLYLGQSLTKLTQEQYGTSHCICVNHLLGNTGIVWHVTLYLCQSFTGQYRGSIVRYIVSVLIIYWTIQWQYGMSHCVCVNHLLVNTDVVRHITPYLCQLFTGQCRGSIVRHIVFVSIIYGHYRGSIVRHIVCVSIIYLAIQKQYCTSRCMCQSFTS